ncbi:MAG: stage V sporulation protein AA [bacterium]|nr:stage V sporulation protein AA [bacterium]
MSDTVFLSIHSITQVHRPDVFLADVAEVYCKNRALESRCKAIKLTGMAKTEKPYMGSVLDVVKKIESLDAKVEIQNLGETDFIVAYEPEHKERELWQWMKTLFVCVLSFCGGGFAIMTFNNDANVTQVFAKIYEAVMGESSDGFTILEISYSLGLTLGILGFFNHIFRLQLTKDPTPLEVEMRLYEDDVNKTLIQNKGRKESGVDVT